MSKIKQSLVGIQSMNEIEPTLVMLVLRNSDYFKRLSSRFLSGSGLPKATYGQGPLSYEGKHNKNETIFGGINRADKDRCIFVFFGKTGVSQLTSALYDEQYSDIWPNTSFGRVEGELSILVSKEMELKLSEEFNIRGTNEEKSEVSLKELASQLTDDKEFRPKAYFSSQKKVLVLGTTSSTQLMLGVEKSTKGDQDRIVARTSFNNSTAQNIHAAVIGSNAKTFEAPIAMTISKLLSFKTPNPITQAICDLCNTYKDTSVLLTKRERSNVKLHSKVIYLRGALNSMLKNLEELPASDAKQYSIVLEPFIKQLIELAKTNDPAQQALNVLKQQLAPASVETKKGGGS